MQTGPPFEIDINGLVMKATGYIINNDEVFRIEFSDGRPPLVITETYAGAKMTYHRFWTSVPQGRQKEAAFFGKKIAEHFKTK